MAAEGHSDKMAPDMEVWMKQSCVTEFLHAEKTDTHWHSSTLPECFWRPNRRWEHSEAVGGAGHLCWCRFLSAQHAGSCSLLQKCIANGGDYVQKLFCCWEFALSNSVIVLFEPVAVSMEINRNFYFLSDLCIYKDGRDSLSGDRVTEQGVTVLTKKK